MFQNCKGCLQLVPKSSYFDLKFCNDLRPPFRLECSVHRILTPQSELVLPLQRDCFIARARAVVYKIVFNRKRATREYVDLFSYVVL